MSEAWRWVERANGKIPGDEGGGDGGVAGRWEGGVGKTQTQHQGGRRGSTAHLARRGLWASGWAATPGTRFLAGNPVGPIHRRAVVTCSISW